MNKIVAFGMVFLAMVSCKEIQKENQELTSKTAVIDSMKLEMEKQRIIDSVKMAENSKKEAVVVNTTDSQSNPTAAPRKKMSGAAKGALIGAGVGAVTGAIVSDKKTEGAIIGGVAGAGVGAGTGAIIDEIKKK
ncbi:hypothetical protein FSS13T_08700 [Flavobacterium saliperosum S13]|uniref:YMGG-like Gly-zipper domain-containing protein n=2 Tax=Flavobacterium saliperosum TaxID=329186 RepID=A0A1G4VV83_9FLAO|nr:YMGG-like glycine zipper-containing protein [Flavobacterium saliperosum]ESU27105.1 hypothetical protein FSS13T_08700 [Flavobacterium saliperosum S13]SCX12423.1 hypothetical protein SAMN02927925_01795 [Flavobacterium saliperosum]